MSVAQRRGRRNSSPPRQLMHAGLALGWWLPLAVTPVVFAVLAAVTSRYFPAAAGSGIPNAMAALQAGSTEVVERLLDLRMILARILMSATAILCGASVGREGPTVHVGAAIAYYFGRIMPQYAPGRGRRALILAGGAAGVAAAFNTPLAGIVFAIEELARSYEARASGTTLVAVLIAGIVSLALVGDYTYFGQPRLTSSPADLLLPAAALGTGYEPARAILEGGSTSLAFVPAKFLATLASLLAGIPGGLFAPSLSLGAGLGQLAGAIPGLDVPGLAVLGTCAYLTGVTQAPMTAFIIVMEMTGLHELILPLMVAALLSSGTSRLVSGSLYRTLAGRITREGLPAAGTVAQGGEVSGR